MLAAASAGRQVRPDTEQNGRARRTPAGIRENKDFAVWTPSRSPRAATGFRAVLGMTSAPPGLDCLCPVETTGFGPGVARRDSPPAFARLAWIGVRRDSACRYFTRGPASGAVCPAKWTVGCGPCQADAREITPGRMLPDPEAVEYLGLGVSLRGGDRVRSRKCLFCLAFWVPVFACGETGMTTN